jgi:DNA-binding transcriptional ArsR family regulator
VVNLAPLADPTRQRIVELLAERELSSGEIAASFDISAPAVSQHLAVLREGGFVRCRVEGARRIYELDAAGFAGIEHWLAHLKGFWQTRLNRLEGRLRAKPRPSRKRRGPKHE